MVTITCSVSRLHIFWRDALSFRQWKSKRYCWSSSLYFPNQRNTYQRYIILRGKMEIMRLYHILKYIQIYIRKAFSVGYKLQVPYLQLCWNTSWTESVLVLFLNLLIVFSLDKYRDLLRYIQKPVGVLLKRCS